jgi:DNA repair photolyase
VTRDAELCVRSPRLSDVTVNLSITTVDARLARRLEPRAPRPDLRFAAMKALGDAGGRRAACSSCRSCRT